MSWTLSVYTNFLKEAPIFFFAFSTEEGVVSQKAWIQ
jgi:hypothetical protein